MVNWTRTILTALGVLIWNFSNFLYNVVLPSADVSVRMGQMDIEGAAMANRAMETSVNSLQGYATLALFVFLILVWFKPAKDLISKLREENV